MHRQTSKKRPNLNFNDPALGQGGMMMAMTIMMMMMLRRRRWRRNEDDDADDTPVCLSAPALSGPQVLEESIVEPQ